MMPKPVLEQGRGMRLLLVEDQPADAELVLQALSRIGWPAEMQVSPDGQHALDTLDAQIVEGGGPDLVLLDLNLPKVPGLEVLRRMKMDARLQHIPVVVLSTSGNPEHVAAAYGGYAAAYLQKPGDFRELVEQMRGVVELWGRKALLRGQA